MNARLAGFSIVILTVGSARSEEPVVAPKPGDAAVPAERVGERELAWLESLNAAYTQAQRQSRPILVVAGGEWCPYCRLLEREIAKPGPQEELGRWIRVSLDVDDAPEEARALAVEGIPALRLLSPAGEQVAAHEGAMSATELVRWLQEHYEEAAGAPPAVLAGTGPPDDATLRRLVQEFRRRDAALREAAVRRLIPHVETAAPTTVAAFRDGPLAARLTALELLREWDAPVAELDPWRPDTLTEERLAALTDWAEGATGESADEVPQEPAAAELESARRSLERMLAADPVEARAIRERLARLGGALLPEVYARLQAATSDVDRERLTALRYRLVATDALVLDWPGGLERLAATDLETRQQAADELAARATAADEPLLLELFSDPAPIVREISLRALRNVGGSGTNSALVRLLDDPDPNVRAAVLKELAEDPPQTIVPKIAEYVAREQDADLVVHAVRLLREAGGKERLTTLRSLLEHESWRVRAESAEAIGKAVGRSSNLNATEKADAYHALILTLKDEDGFVVSRAVQALASADLLASVDPLAESATAHPELADEVVRALVQGNKPRQKIIPHLERFAGHEAASVRAAAIGGLCRFLADESREHLEQALADPESQVRIAAADAFFELLRRNRPQNPVAAGDAIEIEETSGGFLGGLLGLLGPKQAAPAVAEPAVGEQAATETPENAPETASTADAPLQRIRGGEAFKKWHHELTERLEPLLRAESADERVAAALPLAALGRDELALPVLNDAVAQNRHLIPKIAKALPWLLWPDRSALFDRLIASSGTDEMSAIVDSFAEVADPRAAQRVWELLARPETDAAMAESIRESLFRVYFSSDYWSPSQAPADQRLAAIRDATPRAESGPRWQRLTALSLLLPLRAETAAEIARSLSEDESASPDLRADAFQVYLLAARDSEATQAAIAALSSPSADLRGRALKFLAMERARLMSLQPGHFVLTNQSSSIDPFGSGLSGRPALPEAPPGLEPDMLMPLLDSGDPELAAIAGYFLTLLDRPAGLPVLLQYWEKNASQDREWTRLVYGAIAWLDDPQYIPVLEQIYERLRKEEYPDYRDFYWTIRAMTVPEALELRQRIRDEVGMDALR